LVSWDDIAQEKAAISDIGLQLVNVQWIAGLKNYPSGDHGMRSREQLAHIFYE
jgi:hypothetical protein